MKDAKKKDTKKEDKKVLDVKDTKKKDAKKEDKEVLDVLHQCKPTTTKVSARVKNQRKTTFKTPAPATVEQPAKKVAKYFQYKQCINNFVISGLSTSQAPKKEDSHASKKDL